MGNRPNYVSEDISSVSLLQDRWEQIRKNAAERATQQQSESQTQEGDSAQEPLSDDDGDTSGEESKHIITIILMYMLKSCSN